jgi:hypothetical protein
MNDYYATLGVNRSASIADIRRAYRARMRSAHPDARTSGSAVGGSGSFNGASTTAEVTRIAEAWDVLSSPTRRAAYDQQFTTRTVVPEMEPDRVYAPARFPWRFVLVVIGLGSLFVVILHIMGDPMPRRGIDGLINPGSCVNFDELGAAFEVECDGPYQAVVRELVPFNSACDSDTTQARDRQGMGTVCLEP